MSKLIDRILIVGGVVSVALLLPGFIRGAVELLVQYGQ